MARYIDADEFVKRVIQYPRQSTKTIGLALADTPTADVVEVKKGKWFFSDTDFLTHCSNCGQSEWKGYCPTPEEATEWMPICPKCGADMRKGTEDGAKN